MPPPPDAAHVAVLGSPLPQRLLLEQTVSADITGTVAEAAAALLEPTGWDWVLSTPNGSLGEAKAFHVDTLPLWQALDELLAVYGYDWGVVRYGAVVCWRALSPPRERGAPGKRSRPGGGPVGPVDAGGQASDASEPDETRPMVVPEARRRDVRFAEPATWEQWVQAGEPTATNTSGLAFGPSEALDPPALDPEYADWRLVGHTASASTATRLTRLAAAVNGQGMSARGLSKVIPGPFLRYDWALRRANAIKAQAGEGLTDAELRRRIRDGLSLQASAQQYALAREGSNIQVPFCEMPTEMAALVLIAMERSDLGEGVRWPVPLEWRHPERISISTEPASVPRIEGGDPAAWMALPFRISIWCPQTDGSIRVLPLR